MVGREGLKGGRKAQGSPEGRGAGERGRVEVKGEAVERKANTSNRPRMGARGRGGGGGGGQSGRGRGGKTGRGNSTSCAVEQVARINWKCNRGKRNSLGTGTGRGGQRRREPRRGEGRGGGREEEGAKAGRAGGSLLANGEAAIAGEGPAANAPPGWVAPKGLWAAGVEAPGGRGGNGHGRVRSGKPPALPPHAPSPFHGSFKGKSHAGHSRHGSDPICSGRFSIHPFGDLYINPSARPHTLTPPPPPPRGRPLPTSVFLPSVRPSIRPSIHLSIHPPAPFPGPATPPDLIHPHPLGPPRPHIPPIHASIPFPTHASSTRPLPMHLKPPPPPTPPPPPHSLSPLIFASRRP